MYKRVVIKFSGEQLAGQREMGIDLATTRHIAGEVKAALTSGCQLILVIGGGNIVRGAELAGGGIKRSTADQMGMLGGLINAMAMTDVFESEGLETRCMSNIFATQVAESYSFRLAEKHLERNRVLIIAGGIARPYFTNDTAAVSIGLELGCELMLKATKVDGVYDKDPNKFTDAVRIPKLTHQYALETAAIKVMDKAALGLALEQNMPVMVLEAFKPGNLLRAIQGQDVGTLIVD